MSIADLRKDYTLRGLDVADLDRDPLAQFRSWFETAVQAGLPEPNAMTLASATRAGRPSARVVLLKGLDARGFVFYSNFESRKGRELIENSFAALVFLWDELERQVRVEGAVEQVAAGEADAYFASRPWGSRLGAWASAQSAVLADRAALEARYAALAVQYEGQDVPRPPHWGGFRVVPDTLEFWQGRSSRLHDRLRYTRTGDEWRVERLSP
ncbi:MAG: pyridoxamine 5'-phosphate oxidase [Roseiflexaceae bacterium]|nr:pyridoxamine 5'-phosphate oxidase [Roseiflexaceae bacterium]